ncbi:hypothetical protein [Singulisphaera acidiphila]|uniref:hypothetical protein n=1 Tax=Singulisphaera acidiphila TaxID=466153 RepID=UPI0012B5ED25|nr:hypothetical protein [Singulisphaera acidiphila]
MRLPSTLMWALFALLITRMIAAPLALPPASSRSHPTCQLIVRVCQWSAQRSERLALTTSHRCVSPDHESYRIAGHLLLRSAPGFVSEITEAGLLARRSLLPDPGALPLNGCLRC